MIRERQSQKTKVLKTKLFSKVLDVPSQRASRPFVGQRKTIKVRNTHI
jgi:hypothetical protein